MSEQMPASKAISALLATQLMAAEVYSTFLHLSSDGDEFLWKQMLKDELEHVEYLRRLVFSAPPGALDFCLPFVNISRMQETCSKVLEHGTEQFLLRLEGALRVEIAELDFGLEGLIAKKMKKNHLLQDYPGDIALHISNLLTEAKRYSQSPNIGMQIMRLSELYETCLSSADSPVSRDSHRAYP